MVVLRVLPDFPGRCAQAGLADVTGSTGLLWMDILGARSCGLFPRGSAGPGNLATPERLDDAHRSAEGWFGIDDPLGIAERGKPCRKSLVIGKFNEIAVEGQLTSLMQSPEPVEEQAAEQPR